MTPFGKWLDKAPRGTATRLVREQVISSASIHKLRTGGLLSDYAVAKRLSEATGGALSIADLCESPKRGRR